MQWYSFLTGRSPPFWKKSKRKAQASRRETEDNWRKQCRGKSSWRKSTEGVLLSCLNVVFEVMVSEMVNAMFYAWTAKIWIWSAFGLYSPVFAPNGLIWTVIPICIHRLSFIFGTRPPWHPMMVESNLDQPIGKLMMKSQLVVMFLVYSWPWYTKPCIDNIESM